MKWDEADSKKLLSPQHKASAGPMISATRVFHTWIGDSDRKPTHIHVDLNSPPDEIVLAFFDHAHAFSHSWKGPNVPMSLCGDYLAGQGVPVVHEVMVETAIAIAAVDDDEITRLVNRIPAAYLPDPERAHIMSNLLGRKGLLRGLLPPNP
jgi:hypothetical protein